MNRIVLLGMAGGMLGIAGCGAGIETIYTDSLYSRSMAMQVDGTGEATGVVDRSGGEGTMTVTQKGPRGVVEQADVSVSGSMALGTTVPGDDGLPVDVTSKGDYIPTFENADSFLGEVQEGDHYAIAVYRTDLGNRRYVSYGVTKDEVTASMPNSGAAVYVGQVNGTVYGSQTGEQALSGDVRVDANFGPGVGTVNGRMQNLRLIQGVDNFGLGSDIVMNDTLIANSGYQGTLQLVQPGTNNPSAVMAGSSYAGAFYGSGAPETAGTFQFSAVGAPIDGGGNENIQGVGAFGAAR